MAGMSEPPSKRSRTNGDISGKKQTTLFAAFSRPPATPQVTAPQHLVDLESDAEALNVAATLTAEEIERRAEVDAREAAVRSAAEAAWSPRLGVGWTSAMMAELKRPSVEKILQDVEKLRADPRNVIFPPGPAVFRAFLATPFEKVRVVIVGQDPYHGRGQAVGLSFSVPRGMAVPPSLRNMLKEAGVWPSSHGDLTSWTEQGILLLNSVLTVAEGQPASHKNLGWERFTDAAMRALNYERKGVIFLLWGKDAKEKSKLLDTSRHTVLTAGHPSPLSYENHFKGCDHFRKVNALLAARGEPEINWALSV